jgi:pimeloyl-ACP methyl ester carboxylesterase
MYPLTMNNPVGAARVPARINFDVEREPDTGALPDLSAGRWPIRRVCRSIVAPPEQITASAPECRDSVRTFGVAYTYLQQISDVNLAAEWKKVDVPVLVTYGTSDPTTSVDENQYLVTVINSFHPNRATYAEFRNMGHGLDVVASPLAWLQAITKTSARRVRQRISEACNRVAAERAKYPVTRAADARRTTDLHGIA